MITIRRAHAEEIEQVAAFYRENGYRPAISPTDVIVVAENDGALCGTVRLCQEKGVLALRGMRVNQEMQGQGIGTRLLKTAEPLIGGRECFCIPHRHFRFFYGSIGFVEIEAQQAPVFLSERRTQYSRDYGLDVILIHRPRGQK